MRRTQSKQINRPVAATHSRQGSILVAALVCLALVTLIMLSVFKTSLSQRHQIRLEQQHVQAELLAESGLEKAVARLTTNPKYTGEQWTIEPSQLDSHNSALVKITVEKTEKQQSIGIHVTYPKDSLKSSRATRQLTFAPPTADDTPARKPTADTAPKSVSTTTESPTKPSDNQPTPDAPNTPTKTQVKPAEPAPAEDSE